MYNKPCRSIPLCRCRSSWGHQETKNQSTERYIAHALSLEPLASRRIAGKPNRRKEIPSPKAAASKTDRRIKKGSWPPEGVGLAGSGGQMACPRAIAGTANKAVTSATLIQVFMREFAPFVE